MRQSKEISDTIVEYLKTSNIKYMSYESILQIVDFSKEERKKVDLVLTILKFRGVLKFDLDLMLWKNNYYRGINEKFKE